MDSPFSVIAGILLLLAFLPYTYAIIWKGAKPAKTSWIIWTVLDTIAAVSMFAEDKLNWHITCCVIGAGFIAFLAIRKGESGWTGYDKTCIVGAALAIATGFFVSPVWSIILSQVATFIGSIPTIQNAWKDPKNEDKLAWFLFWMACVFQLLAIANWSDVSEITQPITFFTIESIVFGIVCFKKAPATK